jgi:hypothetical protein
VSDGYAALTEAAETLFASAVHQRARNLKPRRGSGKGLARKGLSEFDADKTIRLFAKLWSARDVVASEPRRLAVLPVTDLDDKHGRRVAFSNEMHDGQDRWDPNVKRPSVLDHIIADDQRAAGHLRLLTVDEIPQAWGTERRITSRTTNTHLTRLARQGYITGSDVAFIEQFGEIAGALSEAEVIALGRHESAEATRDSILFEFKRWIWWSDQLAKHLLAPDVLEHDTRGRQAAHEAWQCWSFAREAYNKAVKERTDYRNAYQRFVRLARDTELHTPFVSGQGSEADIWDDATVTALCAPAHYCWEASNYFFGTLSNCEPFKEWSSVASATIDRAEQGRRRLGWFGSREDRGASMSFDPDDMDVATTPGSRWQGLPPPAEVAADRALLTMRFVPDICELVGDVSTALSRHLPRRLEL